MRINSWIDKIKRIRPYRKNKRENFRFDMAERSTNYEKLFFNKFLETLDQEDFITYPSHEDYDDLRKKIAQYHGFNYKNIFLGPGSGACIESLIHTVSNNKTNIVSSFPCFPMYFIYSDCHNSNFKRVEYDNNNVFSIEKMMSKIDEETSLVILANPNSPYGDFKSKKELYDICRFTKEKGIILLIDEAYVDFAPGDCLELARMFDNILISRTFSKGWGAAGIRIGYLIGNEKIIELISKVQQAYPISGPSLKFAKFLLENKEVFEKYSKRTVLERNKVCKILNETGKYDVLNSNTNFIHIHSTEGSNENMRKILEDSDIAFKFGAIVPGDPRKTWVRLSIGPDMTSLSFFKDLL